MANIFTKTYDLINASLDKQLETLQKKEEPLEKKMKDDGFGTKGLLFDPFLENSNSQGLFRAKPGYITNNILKMAGRRAPAASIILSIRSNEVMSFCRPQASRLDTGYVIKPRDAQTQSNPEEIKKLEDFIQNCGLTEGRSEDEKLTFDQFGYMVTNDMLRYGYAAISRGYTNDDTLRMFYPLSSCDVYYADRKADEKEIHQVRNEWQRALELENGKEQTKNPIDDIDFVQMFGDKVVEEFSRDELIFAKLYHETDADLMGYCISPLEKALSMITAQMQIENHQRGFFTHGVASRGILVIQGDMTPNQLRTLQSQWTQQTTGPLNAWRTPILAGIKGVQWTPLVNGSRDMEYAAYQDHVLRTIHACFIIDPEQTGFGYLSRGTEQRTMGESSNEYKILASQSKGLRPILARIESIINEEVLPRFDKELSDKYEFSFVGLDAETREEENNRLGIEIAVHSTVNDIRQQVEKEPLQYGGDLILNPLLLQTLQANMPKGLFMEVFLGIEGASERPDLQYIPDAMWFQWQQMQMQMLQQQAMAEAGGDPNAEEGDQQDQGDSPKNNKKGPPQKGSAQDGADQAAQQEMMQQQAQAGAMAAQQFMAANAHLFKSSIYSQRMENLMKSKNKAPIDSHNDALYEKLMKDYESASDKLMKEVMSALKEDEHFCGPDCDHPEKK